MLQSLHAARQTGRCCLVLDRGTSHLPGEAGWLCQCPAWAGWGQVLAERPPALQFELLGKGYLCLGDRVVPEGPSTAWLRSQTLGELGWVANVCAFQDCQFLTLFEAVWLLLPQFMLCGPPLCCPTRWRGTARRVCVCGVSPVGSS